MHLVILFVFAFTTYASFCITGVAAILKWSSMLELAEGEIEVKKDLMHMDSNSSTYFKKVNSLKSYTLDEKCEQGKELGVGFQYYTPYLDMGCTGPELKNYKLGGILPHVSGDLLKYCCKGSNITFARYFKSIHDIEANLEEESEIDLSFPIYGLDGKSSMQFKDFPFIPIVTAPKTVLLVPNKLYQSLNTRTQTLMNTIFNAWPMLIFIICSAMLAGLAVWMLDKKKNSQEFPPTFFSGAWEGMWWAFVTMTTVGYGDRSPKSPYARAFCIMWILMGIILISLFTGLVTAALSASATPVFNIPGSKIGAVKGSLEYQFGVGLNADMKGFDSHADMFTALQTLTLHGVLLDNFILSASRDNLEKMELRLEREFDFPVTYGIALQRNSSKTEECFRRYLRVHPQKLFQSISKKLRPFKNPTDEVRLEVAAAETLFYEEPIFKTVVFTECGLLIVALLSGLMWEICVRNKNATTYGMIKKFRKKGQPVAEDDDFDNIANGMLMERTSLNNNSQIKNEEIEALIDQYSDYHNNWMKKMRNITFRTKMDA